MLTGKYITLCMSWIISVMFLPIEEVTRSALIVAFVVFGLLIQIFFGWNKLQEIFLQRALEKFMLNLYKSDDFIDFLAERQKRKNNKNEIGK